MIRSISSSFQSTVAKAAVMGLVLGGFLLTALPASAGLRIYYMRHGETGANVAKDWENTEKGDRPDYVGDAGSFTPLGETQVAAVAEKLKAYSFDLIAVSPMWRTRNTILPYLMANHRQAEVWAELAEFSKSGGGLDHLGAADLPAAGSELLAGESVSLTEPEQSFFQVEAGLRQPKIRKEDARNNAADILRLQRTVIDRIRQRFSGKDASILLVGHSNAGRALLGVLTGDLDAMRHIENTALWMAEEQADGSFKVRMFNDEAIKEKKAVAATRVSQSPDASGGLDPAPSDSFSIAVIPDTQEYLGKGTKIEPQSVDPVTNPIFDAETRWILDNLAAQRIVFVSHVGDIVDKPKIAAQWELAQKFMFRFDGKIPYGISVGNHDMTKDGDSSQFQKYFPSAHFAGTAWYGGTFSGDPSQPGHSGDNANSYQLFSAGGKEFVFLHLECNAPDLVVDWANGILDKYKNRTALITTHMDLGFAEGGPETQKQKIKDGTAVRGRMQWTKCHGEAGNSGVNLWEKLYRKHANLLAVFSGDQGGATAEYVAEIGDHGNTVHCFLSDYGTAALRLYRFLPKENKIKVITYDVESKQLVHQSKYVADPAKHQFEVPLNASLNSAH